MEDITNYRDNNHKELPDQRFQIEVTYEELCAIVALAQNPHPNYQDHLQNMRIFEGIFHEGRYIRDYIAGKNS